MPCWNSKLQRERDEAIARGDKVIQLTGKYMPCNTYQGTNEQLHLRYEGQHEKLARMLCDTIKRMKDDPNLTAALLSDETFEWWQEHKKWDTKTK